MKNKINFIFDTETNGLHNCSVLSISFIICQEDKILNEQTRYYFPKENYYNKHAIAVNGLKKEVIENHRKDIVAHNTNFDLKFLPNKIKIKTKIENQEYSIFCTMQQNRDITPTNKAPSLIEACKNYGIEFDEGEAHRSDYDTLKAYELFVKTMIKRDWS